MIKSLWIENNNRSINVKKKINLNKFFEVKSLDVIFLSIINWVYLFLISKLILFYKIIIKKLLKYFGFKLIRYKLDTEKRNGKKNINVGSGEYEIDGFISVDYYSDSYYLNLVYFNNLLIYFKLSFLTKIKYLKINFKKNNNNNINKKISNVIFI